MSEVFSRLLTCVIACWVGVLPSSSSLFLFFFSFLAHKHRYPANFFNLDKSPLTPPPSLPHMPAIAGAYPLGRVWLRSFSSHETGLPNTRLNRRSSPDGDDDRSPRMCLSSKQKRPSTSPVSGMRTKKARTIVTSD